MIEEFNLGVQFRFGIHTPERDVALAAEQIKLVTAGSASGERKIGDLSIRFTSAVPAVEGTEMDAFMGIPELRFSKQTGDIMTGVRAESADHANFQPPADSL